MSSVENYLKIPKKLFKLGLTNVEVFLLSDILSLSKTGYYKTDGEFSKEFNISRMSAVRARKSLLEKGYIIKEYDQKLRRQVYRAFVSQDTQEPAQEPTPAVLNDDWSPLD